MRWREKPGPVIVITRALIVSLLLATPVASQSVRVLSDRVLTGDVARPLDVRWATDRSVYISSYFAGVLQVDIATGKVAPAAFVQPGRNCSHCSNLGVSSRYIVTSFPVYDLAWKEWSKPQVHRYVFDAIVDLDVHGDQLLMLGSRTEKGRWAPDGAIGWIGTLSKELEDLRPILFSVKGPKAQVISRCGFLEPGGVRFFSDGSFVIVPGVEPNAYLFDRTGKLVHTWQTAKLGFVDRCDLSDDQVVKLSADLEQRTQWRIARTMIDDVLATPAGPALLLHEYRDGTARWTMLVLRRDGPPQRIPLPFSIRSDVSSLQADIRGNRIAFLIRTFSFRRPNANLTSRLIVAELQ